MSGTLASMAEWDGANVSGRGGPGCGWWLNGPLRENGADAQADLEWARKARRAFEIMDRRGKQGWVMHCDQFGRWYILDGKNWRPSELWASDPFVCWIETEGWYVANVEAAREAAERP